VCNPEGPEMPKTSAKVAKVTEAKSKTAGEKKVTTKKAVGNKTAVGKARKAPKNQIKKKIQLAKKDNPLFEARPRNFGIGNAIQPKRDLTRFVKWPKYIRIQRQKRILLTRLKVPGTVNQFNLTADKNTSHALFKLLANHKPETRIEKKKRQIAEAKQILEQQKAAAELRKAGKSGEKVVAKSVKSADRKPVIHFGLKNVTNLVEQRKARLVIIAHDVDPLELVLWLPTLCKKKDIPYMIVKGKANLGTLVHKKTAAAIAVTDLGKGSEKELEVLIQKARENFLDRYSETVKRSGGQVMGAKHRANRARIEKALRNEERNKAKVV